MQEKIISFKKEHAEISDRLANDASVFSSPEYPKLAKRQKFLDEVIATSELIDKLNDDKRQAEELASSDDEMAELAKAELADINNHLENAESKLLELLTPKDPNDDKNAILEIRAGAGGDEASLFASELYRMYVRYAESKDFKVELLSESPSEAGGYKEISFIVKGDLAYSIFKLEAGVHRVQRVPETESQGRIHTSTVTVAVLPEAEETDLVINQNDLRIDVYRSGGNGGQSVNTTDSAVRITHIPTGIVVAMQDEKSQLKNKEKALNVLRSRLLQAKIDEENAKLSAERKALIGSGDRSEKIRTYNFPQSRVTDHRINKTVYQLDHVLNGSIDEFIEELAAFDQAQRLEALSAETGAAPL